MNAAICIGVSAKLGGGKTTLANALAKLLTCNVASFGEYVRGVATSRGISHEREDLQKLGKGLIHELGFDEFTANVLAAAGWSANLPLVVEGIRHVDAVESVRRAASGTEFFLVYIDAEEDQRLTRIEARDLATHERIKRWDSHSTEREVEALRELADFVVTSSGSPHDVAVEIVGSIRAARDATE